MTKEKYLERLSETIIHIGKNPSYLDNLAKALMEDSNITEDDKNAVLMEIALKSNEIFNSQDNETSVKLRPDSLFPSYKFLDDDTNDLECGLLAQNRNKYEHYSHWLISEFLPTFHPLPRGDLQYPVIACLMLLNSMAAKKTTKFPLIWIQGLSGCGKSALLESFGFHYPQQLICNVSPDITGASLRDELDMRFGSGLPGIMLWDNFWILECLRKIDTQRSIILANNRLHSKSTLSTRGDNSQREFRTHCIKVFSTVDDGKEGCTTNGMAEITRRLWIVTCKNTGDKPPSRELFSWSKMIDEYDQIWGHQNKINLETDYLKCFQKVQRVKADRIPFDAKIWEILIPCLAVWQFCRIGSLDEGINAFLEHRNWTYAIDTAQTDIYLQSIRDFMNQLDKEAEKFSNGLNPLMTPEKIKSQISPQTLIDHIQQLLPSANITQTVLEQKIAPIMATYGYLYRVVNSKALFIKI